MTMNQNSESMNVFAALQIEISAIWTAPTMHISGLLQGSNMLNYCQCQPVMCLKDNNLKNAKSETETQPTYKSDSLLKRVHSHRFLQS